MPNLCYCGNIISFARCCQAIISGKVTALTAEQLMRSRYSAYVVNNAVYLLATTHSTTRGNYTKEEIEKWASSNQWIGLEIIEVAENTVSFKAHFLDESRAEQVHYEESTFVKENGKWYYVSGVYE